MSPSLTSPAPRTPTTVEQIAQAVLYEGYILYPYRPSVKNTQRWTFGGLYPQAYMEANPSPSDRCLMQTQCLLLPTPAATVSVSVRFLHLVERTVAQFAEPLAHWPSPTEPPFHPVESLAVAGQTHYSWQEASERQIPIGPLPIADLLAAPFHYSFSFAAHRATEPLPDPHTGHIPAMFIRQQQPLQGVLDVSAAPVSKGLTRVTLRIRNDTPWRPAPSVPHSAFSIQNSAFLSTHAILTAQNARFVSLIDPPEACQEAAAACENLGAFPVLVGTPPDADTLLASPIILYDYPQIAPESPGDLFDGTEIDEILTLRIHTLTDQEKRDILSLDPRARALLERTETLAAHELAALHGTLRNKHPVPAPHGEAS